MLTEVLVVAISVFLILVSWMRNRPNLPKTYPRGPTGWPLFGNLLQLGLRPHLKLTAWSRQYGAVYNLKLGQRRVVVLNSYKALFEAMVERKSDFAGRPLDFVSFKTATGCKNIGFMDYTELCQHLRKTVHAGLRIHGTERWDEIITKHVDILMDAFSERENSAFNPHLPLTMAAFNMISELTYSQCYEENDPEFTRFAEMSNKTVRYIGETSPLDFVGWLKPLFKAKLREFKKLALEISNFLTGKLRNRMDTFDRENPLDILDMLILAKENYKPAQGHANMVDEFDDDVVAQTMNDVVAAGSETVVSASKWLLINLMFNPGIQKKIHKEIDEVVGRHRRPVYADHDKLHYLKAAMYEALRLHTVLPLSVFHRTIRTTSVSECQIPDDTIIIPNMWGIDHDPDIFKDPYVFRPERFIDPETGKFIPLSDMNVSPFSMGKRVCLGETLAKREYFLIAANLMHKFEVKMPSENEKPSTEGILGLTYHPKPFKVLVRKRDSD
ncbi:steroid 17-alpha-hydroxylase/17,20 lyase-like [Glandiceps talaboti]